MPTLKEIIGYNTVEKAFDTFGRAYLKEATNPGSMLAHEGILIVRDDNKSFTIGETEEVILSLEKILERNADKS